MPIPNIQLSISGNAVAVYAAIVSTATGIFQVLNYLRDKAHVMVTVQRDMQMMGDDRYTGQTLTMVKAVNGGRRPVTITHIGAVRKFGNTSYLLTDTRPQLPCELTEGKYITGLMDEEGVDFSTIVYWAAWTATNRMFRCYTASRNDQWKLKAQERLDKWTRGKYRAKVKAKLKGGGL